jgi:hypothetical protein
VTGESIQRRCKMLRLHSVGQDAVRVAVCWNNSGSGDKLLSIILLKVQ